MHGRVWLSTVAAAVLGLALGAGPANAATIQVDSKTDDGTGCTLRDALASATANADQPGCSGSGAYGDDTVTFAPSVTGDIQLQGSQLLIDGSGTLDVIGPGSDQLDLVGPPGDRVLGQNPGPTTTISGLTIRGGNLTNTGEEFVEARGGGIANYGSLTLDRVSVEGNSLAAVSQGGFPAYAQARGGGIYSEGTLVVRRSIIDGNTAAAGATADDQAYSDGDGGGIWSRGTTQVLDSTISDNRAKANSDSGFIVNAVANGGGISIFRTNATIRGDTIVDNGVQSSDGGINSRGGGVALSAESGETVTLKSDTITGNSAASGANVLKSGGFMTAENTVLADPVGAASCSTSGVNPAPASLGHNLSEDASCGFAGTGDVQGVDPGLLPLADNGGPTPTRLPTTPSTGSPSPLIDAGVASGVAADQRGLARTHDFPGVADGAGGDATDIGSVEVQASDDAQQPTVTIGDANATEGQPETFTVSLNKVSSSAVTVQYSTVDGSADAPGDYTATTGGTVTFAPGDTSEPVSIPTTNDVVDEDAEGFKVVLSSPSGGTINDGEGSATIVDDDPQAVVALTGGSATEGGEVTFTATKTGATAKTVTATYTTLDGGATAPADYESTSGTLTFAPAETTKTVTVSTAGDAIDEADESFSLFLPLLVNADLAPGGGEVPGTILDDDAEPVLRVSGGDATEGGGVQFTVTKTGATERSVSASYATADGSATAPGDYASAAGTVTLGPSEATKTFTVSTVADTAFELDESFTATLTSPVHATLEGGSATGTIRNDDSPEQAPPAKPRKCKKPKKSSASVAKKKRCKKKKKR